MAYHWSDLYCSSGFSLGFSFKEFLGVGALDVSRRVDFVPRYDSEVEVKSKRDKGYGTSAPVTALSISNQS